MSYKRLDKEDVIVSSESIVTSAWTGNSPVLSDFEVNNTQQNSAQGDFYWNVYNLPPANTASEVQFTLSYGNKSGDQADPFNVNIPTKTPTSTIFGQYRNLVLGDEEGEFYFGNDTPATDILVINIDRSRYKEKLLPGSFSLTLSDGTNELEIKDNSKEQLTQIFTDSGRVFDLVFASGTNVVDQNLVYGKLYPDVGVIIINPAALRATPANGGLSLDTITTANNRTRERFWTLLQPTAASFSLQSEETISSKYVFIRARNNEFNYSTNPSIIDEDGTLFDPTLINTPQSFITTVGLYNDSNDLVAVAKLSRPLLKDFTKEALLRIKLDF